MKNKEIHTVVMTRRIRDEIYEKTKDLSEEELIRFFREKAATSACSMIRVEVLMRTFTAIIEKCPETRLYVGYVPGFPGAHSQGETLDELNDNLREMLSLLLEDGEPALEATSN